MFAKGSEPSVITLRLKTPKTSLGPNLHKHASFLSRSWRTPCREQVPRRVHTLSHMQRRHQRGPFEGIMQGRQLEISPLKKHSSVANCTISQDRSGRAGFKRRVKTNTGFSESETPQSETKHRTPQVLRGIGFTRGFD